MKLFAALIHSPRVPIVILFGLLAIPRAQAQAQDQNPDQPRTQKSLAQPTESDLTFKIFRILAKTSQNVDYSPLSLEVAFSLVYPGARGATAKLYEKIFGFDEAHLNPFQAEYVLARNSGAGSEGADSLSIQNSVWMKNETTLKEDFKKSLEKQSAEIGKLDLSAINQWVSRATRGKIKQLLDAIPRDSQSIFVNTLYFKQDWVNPFRTELTHVENFNLDSKNHKTVATLHADEKLAYFEDKNSKWVSLRYAHSPFVMWLALPKKRFDLETVEVSLNAKKLAAVSDGLAVAQVKLALPKFKFDQKRLLSSVFRNAGYGGLFDQPADYSGVSTDSFALSEIIQATTIAVDEKGTEASAATAVVLKSLAISTIRYPSRDFIADQPFLFILRNEETKAIYWLGRVSDPSVAN